MCGIAGIIASDPSHVSQERLKKMTDAIRHRGPEGEGLWIDEHQRAGLGHRRLAILDLTAAGAQPMHYLHRYTITYNGELYNYREVKKELENEGYGFATSGDTEVLIAAYDCYGTTCLQHFDGMFAFAIWDSIEKSLFCARDRFGEKPFYYHFQNDVFLFASEMKALWAGGIERTINNTMLLNYLGAGLLNSSLQQSVTFYEHIYSIPAAHFMVVHLNETTAGTSLGVEQQVYWGIDKESTAAITENDATDTFLQLVNISVRRRLRSDVASGTSLSGGLDSSSIVSLIHQHYADTTTYSHNSFSAVFPGFEKNESRYINEVVSKFQLQSFTVTPTASEFLDDFEKLIYHQEEPFQSASVYAQYKVYELAAKHGVTVLLDGQGADEVLAGYSKYYHWYWQQLLRERQWSKFRIEKEGATELGINIPFGIKNYLAAAMPAQATRQLEKRILSQLKNSSIHPDFVRAYLQPKLVYKPVVEKLNDVLYYNTMQSGLGELLRYADRNAMAHSKEVRLPFLNHELVQFIFSLPPDLKIRQGWTKWILRHAMNKHLPPEITWRKDKVGFEPPQHQWLQHKGFVDLAYQQKQKLVRNGILNKSVLNKPVVAPGAHVANNHYWRYLCAGHFI